MNYIIPSENILSLYELNLLIQNTLDNAFYGKYFWIKAEIHKLNFYPYSGHAYPDLLEKKGNEVICQMRGILWKSDLQRIHQKFMDTIGEPLKDNITALMCVTIRFDPKHGLSLQIKDIDPNYTLGELERQKKHTIEELKKQNIFDANKKLKLVPVPQKIAVISVETSKGYRDLISTFQKYQDRFQIVYDLYPSLLQGEEAAVQIRNTLNFIKKKHKRYDAVLIIRGGGGEVGLSCYNDYELCKTIALFPIPVITGIGHSTNFTVAEMVAYHNGITPTDVAMYIIHKFEEFEEKIIDTQNAITSYLKSYFQNQYFLLEQLSKTISIHIKDILHQQNLALATYEQFFKSVPKNIIYKQQQKLIHLTNKIKQLTNSTFRNQEQKLIYFTNEINRITNSKIHNEKQKLHIHQQKIKHIPYAYIAYQKQYVKNTSHRVYQLVINTIRVKTIQLNNIDKNLQLLHPQNILKRGYSIVFNENGHSINTASKLSEGTKIKIKFYSSEAETILTQLKIKHYEQ